MAARCRTLVAAGHTVVLLLSRHHGCAGFDRHCEAKAIKLGFIDCRGLMNSVPRQPSEADAFLRALADRYDRVHYFGASDIVCSGSVCSAYIGRRPVYYDSAHFSMEGSWKIGRLYEERFGVPDFLAHAGEPAHSPGSPD